MKQSNVTTVQMYKTSDGKTFETQEDALIHQEQLDKPKVYFVEEDYGSAKTNIVKAFLTLEKAREFKKTMEIENRNYYYEIKAVEFDII